MPRKPKQRVLLPELEPPRIPEIEDAADDYVEFRDARMAALKSEVEAKDRLHELMRQHKLQVYDMDAQVVELKSTEDLKVRRKQAPKNGEGDL